LKSRFRSLQGSERTYTVSRRFYSGERPPCDRRGKCSLFGRAAKDPETQEGEPDPAERRAALLRKINVSYDQIYLAGEYPPQQKNGVMPPSEREKGKRSTPGRLKKKKGCDLNYLRRGENVKIVGKKRADRSGSRKPPIGGNCPRGGEKWSMRHKMHGGGGRSDSVKG